MNQDIAQAHSTVTDLFGGTIIGAILQVIIGTTTLFVEVYTSGIDMDEFTKWAIKIGSLIVVILGIVNGWLAYKKNKIELAKLQNEQRTNNNR
jgi:ABC-type nickel/cobalt efflux system permease component RcnA